MQNGNRTIESDSPFQAVPPRKQSGTGKPFIVQTQSNLFTQTGFNLVNRQDRKEGLVKLRGATTERVMSIRPPQTKP